MQNESITNKQLKNWNIYPRSQTLNHAYWFRYILEDEKSKTEIHYKILVRYLREGTGETDLYFIHRISDVYINDELPDLCMDELAYETGKVFYPMVIEIDKKNQWVELRNYTQIKDNWINTVRPFVQLRFGGEIGEKYLARMDNVIQSKHSIEEAFKNDLFFRFYFNTFYHSYSQKFEIDRVLEFPVGKDSLSYFKTKCSLNRNLTDRGYKEITQNGISVIKSTSGEEYMPDNQFTYSAKILLETKTNYVKEAMAEWRSDQRQQKTTLILFPLRQQCDEDFNIQIDKSNNNKPLLSKLFGQENAKNR